MEEVIDDVPVWPTCTSKRSNPYGSVPGLPDEELADPEELERLAMIAEWGPILALPVQSARSYIRPTIDDGKPNWGAFGTVDFDRMQPFDKCRYKADRLREELRSTLIMISPVQERLPQKAMYLVLQYVREGVIERGDIASEDMREMLRLHQRATRLREEIYELNNDSRRRERVTLALD